MIRRGPSSAGPPRGLPGPAEAPAAKGSPWGAPLQHPHCRAGAGMLLCRNWRTIPLGCRVLGFVMTIGKRPEDPGVRSGSDDLLALYIREQRATQ